MHVEKLGTQKALRRKLQLENAVTEGQLVQRSELMKVFSAIADAITSRIMASALSRSEKEDILRDISSIPVVLTGRGRLARGNGAQPAEVVNES
jgi:hypothetical protein